MVMSLGSFCDLDEAEESSSGESGTGNVAVPNANEATPAEQPSPPALAGAYELRWIDGANGRQPMPDTLLRQMPGCVWGRWLWNFGPTDELSIHNELLCEEPNMGTGICRAEFQTKIRWAQGSFVVPASIQAKSQFVNLRPQGRSWAESGGAHNTTTIRCNVNLSAVNATLSEIVPGQHPNRPREVTLDIGNGERIRLVAAQTEVNYSQIMLRHALSQPATGIPPTIPIPQTPVPSPAPQLTPTPPPMTPAPPPPNPY